MNDQVETKEDKDGMLTVKYHPMERGMHELHVTTVASGSDLRMPLKGSPFKFFVDNAASGNVTAYGPGLSHGITGQPAEFTVDMKNAGAGALQCFYLLLSMTFQKHIGALENCQNCIPPSGK